MRIAWRIGRYLRLGRRAVVVLVDDVSLIVVFWRRRRLMRRRHRHGVYYVHVSLEEGLE